MIVFKTFLRVLNQCKVPIILYTVILVAFAGFNMQTSDSSAGFTASKPDVLLINEDDNTGITKGLTEYIESTCTIVDIKNDEDAINDALFYRDVNYIIYIPQHYREDFLNGLNPEIKIKSTGDFQASYAEMLLSRYIKVATIYARYIEDEEELTAKIHDTLSKQTEVEITSKLDTNRLTKSAFYYNFANYSILAGCVYVICLILSSFKDEKIRKRTTISSMEYKKYNRLLLLSNSLFAVVLWLFYVLLSFVLVGNIMFSAQGLVLILNSFVFTLCALTIAFLIGNLVKNKNAVNGIVNVVALGSSFLCGAFVPVEWLPNSVLTVAHILPSYWYIQTNERLKTMEVLNVETLRPILFNMGMLLVFALVFTVAANVVSRARRKIG